MPEPFPDSLCHRCEKHRRVESDRGVVYLRCTDPSRPKYGPQPVIECAAFAEFPDDSSSAKI